MASFLDVSGLEHFSAVFVFIFVIVAIWAVLTYTKMMEDHKWVVTIASVVIGLFVLMSPIATKIVSNIAPWLAVLFVFIVLITVASKMVGDIDMGGMKHMFFLAVVIIVIIGAGVTIRNNVSVPGDNESSVDFNRDYSQTSTVLFHPKFMGMLLIMAIAVFTIALLVTNKM